MDYNNIFGKSAGKIWKTLHEKGPLNEKYLLNYSKLSKDEFFIAIGWLARENKICKNDDTYRLDTSNLDFLIGNNAGKVWNTLNQYGKTEVEKIGNLTNLENPDVYSAIGWLARENKILGIKSKIKSREPHLKFYLK